MKKKFKALLVTIACVFTLTACGGSEYTQLDGNQIDQQTEAALVKYAEQAVMSVEQYQGQDPAALENDYDIPYWVSDGLKSWNNAIQDLGQISGDENQFILDQAEAVRISRDEYEARIGIDGTDHDAEALVTYNYDTTSQSLSVKSVTFNVFYTMGEKMAQAGMNTVLGMGTTFVVLIILSLLISLFKYIPALQKKFQHSEEEEEPETISAPAAATAAAEPETDDQELIAVIAAAVAASEGKKSTDGFVVRSIRKSRNRF